MLSLRKASKLACEHCFPSFAYLINFSSDTLDRVYTVASVFWDPHQLVGQYSCCGWSSLVYVLLCWGLVPTSTPSIWFHLCFPNCGFFRCLPKSCCSGSAAFLLHLLLVCIPVRDVHNRKICFVSFWICSLSYSFCFNLFRFVRMIHFQNSFCIFGLVLYINCSKSICLSLFWDYLCILFGLDGGGFIRISES